jgi:anthranilate 1,2-dioxygenase small subunit/terephthalate 1,2-dioxygenase oxygenase component beta subunit
MLSRVITFNAAYARAIDSDRLEEWPEFFVDDCLYRVTSAENQRKGYAAGIIYADSKAMLRDRVTALRTANIFERQTYRHVIGAPVIAPDGVTAETPFMIARIMRDGRTDLFATGVYLDRFADTDGRLLLIERVVVCDSGHFDTLVAIPL